MAGLYQGSLKLDRVTGIRHDKGQRMTPIQSLIKPDTTFQQPPKAMKISPNVTGDGLKKS